MRWGHVPNRFAKFADGVLEASVAGSFTRVGSAVRRRLDGWDDAPDGALAGQRIVITGVTSGLGFEVGKQVLRLGAELCFVARNPDKAKVVMGELEALGPGRVWWVKADMGDLESVAQAAREICRRWRKVDALVHNAGALDADFSETPQGIEQTVATHVLGPFLLSLHLENALVAGSAARVIWVSSGGMYAEPLVVDELEMSSGDYNGVTAYARAKRAQVTLASMQAAHWADFGVSVNAMHPGWADTAGVARGLPRFHRLVGPMLRTPADGSDTLVWLLWASAEGIGTGRFWHDRRARSVHRLKKTKRADTESERRRLWDWVNHRVAAYKPNAE